MPNFENIDTVRGLNIDRRSFLRTTGLIAAATMTGGLPFRAITPANQD